MKINANDFSYETGYRPLEGVEELVDALRRHNIVWCWGAHAWTKMNDFCLRFMVNGMLHKGHVYLVVNGGDLFDVYITTSRGRIVHTIKDVFISDLVMAIDAVVEREPVTSKA